MNHDSKNHNKDCICCNAEKLSISCGSSMEAKQYEYNIKDKLTHVDHKEKIDGRPIHKMSGKEHEATMSPSQMAKKMEKDIKLRFWVAFLLTIPIFILSPLGMELLGITWLNYIVANWTLLVLTTVVVFWPGWIFLVGSYNSLKAKKLNMSVLVVTGVLAAYLFSIVLTAIGEKEAFFEAAAMLVTFVLFGHWMEMKSRRGTSDALRALFNLVPPKARIIRDGKEVEILSEELQINDTVIVKPGDKVPVDGEIIEGDTTIDESMVTGESMPVHKKVGDKVVGGAINKTGSVKFKVTQVGGDTTLAQIIKLVEKAQNSKAPGQRLADKASAYLVIIAVASGIITFVAWYFIAQIPLLLSLTFAISAVVIACPDALGLATPTAVAVGTGIGARNNILIKDAATLEQTSKIQAVLIDKTGTLTEGKPVINDIATLPGTSEKDLLYFTASVQKQSNHPFGLAIIAKAKEGSISLSNNITDFKALSGLGVQAKIDGKLVYAGTVSLLAQLGIDSAPLKTKIDEFLQDGKSISLVAIDNKLVGILSAADEIKKSSKQTVEGLKKLGIETIMLTGDNKKVGQYVAQKVGIDRFFAEVLPKDKADYVKKIQDDGKFVAMVGDGINDAPALAQSDIGIAIGAGTDVAIETANIVLMKSDPADILKAIILSKATVKKMRENLFWAAIYNLLAVPVAAGVFYPSFGWFIRPEISALLMSASSIFVAINAVLLKRVEARLKKAE